MGERGKVASMLTRRIEESDLPACIDIFNEAFNDVHHAYGFDEDVVDDDDSWLAKPLRHFLHTDPDGGLIVTDEEGAVAFGSSILRDRYWFLAFLFVRPRAQGRGFGRQLLRQLLPEGNGLTRSTIVESFQATATGLYSSHRMTPCAVKYWLVAATDQLKPSAGTDVLTRKKMSEDDIDEVSSLDRSILGFSRAADHRWWMESLQGYTYTMDRRIVGYAYVDDGWISPALAVDESMLIALFVDLAQVVEKDEVETAIFGTSAKLFRALIQSGFRIGPSKYSSVSSSSEGPLPASYVQHDDWLP